MASSIDTSSMAVIVLLGLLSVCALPVQSSRTGAVVAAASRDHVIRHKLKESDAPLFRPPNDEEKADFSAWVAQVGDKYRQKQEEEQQKKATDESSSLQSAAVDSAIQVSEKASYDGATYIVVDQNGNGQFSKVQDAIDSIPRDQQRTERITIQINPGYYHEKIIVAKNLPHLTLQGGGRDNTVIDYAETKSQAGTDISDATVAISAPNFIARNITIKNSAPAPPSGAVGQQATALYISGDMVSFIGCAIKGAQDTLYDHNGRHYFQECVIEGSIDFIYGDGKSLYKDCQLNVIPTSTGSLTAQKRQGSSEDSGFSFVDCAVTGAGRVYLGRAWGEYSRVVFATTWMADIIIPQGWQNWNDPSRESTVYYGEYHCFGPGANSYGRVGWSHQLTDAEAAPFLNIGFVDGENWIYS